ncbi:MAG TPA: carboxypeptidase regulatory-like domain-containing protein, partial [Longimicrobiaceae bacterium]|nr:carboxypeptidase regulatory-like domain-containing protein [Longimicrobiaceae bacterium]
MLVAGAAGVERGAAQDRPGTTPTTAISGRVLDAETGAPLSSVEVTVQAETDRTVRSGGLTDRTGRFRVVGLGSGGYTIGFRRLGYTGSEQVIDVRGGQPPLDLGAVELVPAAILIREVAVTVERPAVEYAPDRDIYSVAAIQEAAGGTVTDVLAAIPDLDVELDGSVTMRGAVPQIYINGRPAPLEGESLLAFLSQFPAENLETVEVMANPSARYRAEGAGGIVNIVLRRDARLGLNGNVFANGGTRGDVGGGGRATFQDGPLTLRGGSSLRLTQRETTSSELRENLRAIPITFLEQAATSDRSSWSGNVDLSAEYAIRERTTVSVE